MRNLLMFFHLAAAIFWMGGMAFMVLALRPAVAAQLQPPQRLALLQAVLARFFVVVTASIAVLLATGLWWMAEAGAAAPAGWKAMSAVGLVMMLVFGHIYFGPWRRMQAAVGQADWPEAGRRMGQITLLAKINLGLGWIAIAAVILWR
jgi:uncharacterized membrane protein